MFQNKHVIGYLLNLATQANFTAFFSVMLLLLERKHPQKSGVECYNAEFQNHQCLGHTQGDWSQVGQEKNSLPHKLHKVCAIKSCILRQAQHHHKVIQLSTVYDTSVINKMRGLDALLRFTPVMR
ncbi:hypothetical protein E2C01_015908 [Portunus trituberculatus]|uniref:Uncharacterized protein n=1 Tax=Portunus trituberculatus TaxID=210409 RepID=A0A5B7DN32_PORTR|nr:hypothetical protein [Portunus trituberculatus]